MCRIANLLTLKITPLLCSFIPLAYRSLTFGVENGEFITKYIPADDRDVDIKDTFSIVLGYILIDYYGNVVSSDHPTASGMGGAPDSYLVPKTRTQAGNMGTWEMYRYTGSPRSDILLSMRGNFTAGKHVTIRPKPQSTVMNANTPHIYMDDEYILMATCDWDWDTLTATISLHDEGTLRILANIEDHSTGNIPYRGYIEKWVDLPYEEGVFYVRNRNSEKFMQTNNDDDPDFNTTDEVIEVQNFNAGHHQKWELIHAGDGYYYIKTYDSDPNESPVRDLYITVRSGYENSGNKYVAQSELNYSSTQKWKITDYTDGSFVLRPKSAESYSTDWCLAQSSDSPYENVEQRSYDHYSDLAHWYFYKCVGAEEIFLLGIEDSGHDHYSSFLNIIPTLFSMGYSEVSHILSTNFSKDTALSYLDDCDLFVFRGHGGLVLGTGESAIGLGDEYICFSDIVDTENNTLNLIGCELMLFIACKTANEDGTGLPNAAIAAGAECAIGFKDSIYCSSANDFTNFFFGYRAQGYDIRYSAYTAAELCDDPRVLESIDILFK